ncbi:unnamed protein product [Discosporangium mesarthrocarpum]
MKRARETSSSSGGVVTVPMPMKTTANVNSHHAGNTSISGKRGASNEGTMGVAPVHTGRIPAPGKSVTKLGPDVLSTSQCDPPNKGCAPQNDDANSSGAPQPKKARGAVEDWRAIAEKVRAGGQQAETQRDGTSRLSFAVVCSSNINRSIMAQKVLQENNMRVKSYGTGREVRLPGKDARNPKSFAFGTPYLQIYDELEQLDAALFERNSVLSLLRRDAATKVAPERWQDVRGVQIAEFDTVVCFETRVFDQVVEDLQGRDPETFKPLHVVSMTIKDSAEHSAAAAGDVLELCRMLDSCQDLDGDVSDLVETFQAKTKRTMLHQVCHV